MPFAPPTLCFAYGSNLSATQMRSRCPDNTYVGMGLLRGWSWQINTRGFANLVPDSVPATPTTPSSSPPPQNAVVGLLYALSSSDVTSLNRYEGVPWAYTNETLTVEFWDGKETAGMGGTSVEELTRTGSKERREALVYVDRIRVDEGIPSADYVARMERGFEEAAERGAPRDWLETLRGKMAKVRRP